MWIDMDASQGLGCSDIFCYHLRGLSLQSLTDAINRYPGRVFTRLDAWCGWVLGAFSFS
jgi:hypothetical protein